MNWNYLIQSPNKKKQNKMIIQNLTTSHFQKFRKDYEKSFLEMFDV
jgi:hypothetical protein